MVFCSCCVMSERAEENDNHSERDGPGRTAARLKVTVPYDSRTNGFRGCVVVWLAKQTTCGTAVTQMSMCRTSVGYSQSRLPLGAGTASGASTDGKCEGRRPPMIARRQWFRRSWKAPLLASPFNLTSNLPSSSFAQLSTLRCAVGPLLNTLSKTRPSERKRRWLGSEPAGGMIVGMTIG